MIQKPLTEAQIDKADVIFIGHPVKVSVSSKPSTKGIHVITFNVEKVLKGKVIGSQIEVYWQNGTFGEPDTLPEFRERFGSHNKVGIIMPQTIKSHTKCGPVSSHIGGKRITSIDCNLDLPLPFLPQPNLNFDLPWIISDVCSPAFIFKMD